MQLRKQNLASQPERQVEHLLTLVKAIPDSRWRFAFQLMAAYGLRPEELQHLQIRQGRLWCMYEKVASRGKTRPRVLRPLPCDDWSDGWSDGWRLEERFPTQELPPMQPGLGGGYVGHYLMNRPLWKELRREYESKGEKLVPYSCRHGYAHRANVICDLPPKAEQRLGKGLRAQSLSLQGCQVLPDCLGWVPEAGPLLPHRRADPLDIEVQAS